MKITDIEVYFVEVPIRSLEKGGIAPYLGSQDKVGVTKARSALFKLVTDEGIVGWGEMNIFISPLVMMALLNEYIKPLILGMSPFDIRRIMQKFELIYDPQFHIKSLLAGVEVACWDILGKSLGKPIYQLLGGKIRESIPIAYCLGILGIEETKDKVSQVKEEGFSTLKTKGGRDTYFDIERTKAIRKIGGPDFNIRVDMNQGYDILQTLRFVKAVECLNLEYIEQPLRVNALDELKSVRQRTTVPIGINEDCYVPGNLLRAVKGECIDVAIIDYEPLGGISEILKIASLIEEANIPLVHHCGWDLGVKLAAILHVVSALPSFNYPIDSTYFVHEDDVLLERIPVKNGCYVPPEGPGLGVEIDEKKVSELSFV
ncbi:MAG: hypothetical protein PWP04_10 [Candidatus Atribacteria bacterium]|nr:hypothetical protein [Candidatus Atribacteria bacterium]